MGWSINPEYKPLPDAINPYRNVAQTEQVIKEYFKDGTPDWLVHPEDYRSFAKEEMQCNKEQSDSQVAEYQMEDQRELIDFKSRNINIVETKKFVEKLRDNGIKCVALYNGMSQTAGLWAFVPTTHGADVRYVTFVQIPAMIEWSVLQLDDHFLPAGESYRGWRTVISELIKKGVVTERRAHEIFGPPTDSIVSRRYRRSLYNYRNRHEDVAPRDGF
jgi:hypothetical protein